MEVDSVGIIAILSMSYMTTRIVKIQTSVAKIPRVPVENQITTPSVVKFAIKFSPCIKEQYGRTSLLQYFTTIVQIERLYKNCSQYKNTHLFICFYMNRSIDT